MIGCIYIFELSICLSISLPYLLMFGYDRVMCYTQAYDVVGSAGEVERG